MNWISWELKPPPPELVVEIKRGLLIPWNGIDRITVRRCDLAPSFNIADLYWRPTNQEENVE